MGIAALLLARGHSVTVLGDPTVAEQVRDVGATWRPWTTAPQRASEALADDVVKDWECRTPLGALSRLRDRIVAGPADRYAADVLAEVDRQRPDAVLADVVVLGAMVAAEAARLRFAALCPSMYMLPAPDRPLTSDTPLPGKVGSAVDRAVNWLLESMWDRGLPALNRARAGLGLGPLDHLWDQARRADRLLVLTASAFDLAWSPPPKTRYVGPVNFDTPVREPLELPQGDDPLVVVGHSSSWMDQTDVLRRLVTALDGLPVRAVVTTGAAVEPSAVPGTPRVRVVQSAAHTELFAQAQLVVTHAGHGTLLKALAAGVPVLSLPAGRDQPFNARRAERLGAGRTLRPTASIDQIQEAVREIVEGPSYSRAAQRLAAQIRVEVESGALLAELEGLTSAG
jgi:MGT family glycosyltransferase